MKLLYYILLLLLCCNPVEEESRLCQQSGVVLIDEIKEIQIYPVVVDWLSDSCSLDVYVRINENFDWEPVIFYRSQDTIKFIRKGVLGNRINQFDYLASGICN